MSESHGRMNRFCNIVLHKLLNFKATPFTAQRALWILLLGQTHYRWCWK